MINQRPPADSKYNNGLYVPVNKDKVIKLNDKGGIWYRSSWELKVCVFLDHNPEVVKWGCEIVEIQYYDIKGQSHRYYPDFYLEMRTDNPNVYKRMVLEIKPMKETQPPQMPKNPTAKALESFEYQLKLYQKNIYKWQRAIDFCKSRDLQFFLVTENHLNKMTKK
jgi:hypothetical protein